MIDEDKVNNAMKTILTEWYGEENATDSAISESIAYLVDALIDAGYALPYGFEDDYEDDLSDEAYAELIEKEYGKQYAVVSWMTKKLAQDGCSVLSLPREEGLMNAIKFAEDSAFHNDRVEVRSKNGTAVFDFIDEKGRWLV